MTDATEPVFQRPPVAEVTLSVQFESLHSLSAVDIGRLAEMWSGTYPGHEEHDELAPLQDEVAASRAAPSLQLMLVNRSLPRTWFLDEAGEHVVQVQRDRLVLNWRRQDDGSYPHYSELLPRFRTVFEQFAAFVADRGLEIVPNQCHVTYLNPIPLEGEDGCPDGLPGLLAGWSGTYSGPASLPDGDASLQLRYPIADSNDQLVGRLLVSAGSATKAPTGETFLLLEMTARGRPLGPDLEGIVSFLDLGHTAIVTMFAALTTAEMHTVWGRET